MKQSYLQQSIALALSACISAGAWAADNGMELKSETDRASYALGYQIGGDFKRQKMDLNEAAVVRGIADARTGTSSLMTEDAMRTTLIELKRKVMEQESTPSQTVTGANNGPAALEIQKAANGATAATLPHAKRAAAKMTESARQFLDRNALQKGVVTLPSGLQYRVVRQGSGKQAKESDKVALIYRGALVNGNEFGNTDQAGKAVPKVFPLASLVPGMREAVSRMNEGSKWQVFVPPQLGFDASTPLYRKVTVFDVELVAVNP